MNHKGRSTNIMSTGARVDAAVLKETILAEAAGKLKGQYVFECHGPDGTLKWKDTIENLVTTVGANLMLDTLLGGSGYTVTGPYMGLISAVDYGAGPAEGDTMGSHAGWKEAGGTNAPTYSGTRKTVSFSAASGGVKAASSNPVFSITSGSGVTVKGAFLVLGAGASATIDNTGGVLYSAGVFSGGDKVVSNGDTLTVSYQTSLAAP